MVATILSIFAVVASVASASFIWIQARQLQTQNQLQALIQVGSTWNAETMRFQRGVWAADELRTRLTDDGRNLDALEPILEFLEEFAGLLTRRVLDDKLVWDSTIGWHAARYYLYNQDNGNLARLRDKWQDASLYQNLSLLWKRYVEVEARERGISEPELIKQIHATREKFLAAECNAYRLSQSSD
jgi:hypothetical protein